MGQAYKVSCRQAKEMDIVMYLASLGFEPAKIRDNNYWYRSPLRNEYTPSFKVNRQLNRWYDFGLGKGGSLIDFGILFYNCSIADFLSLLSNGNIIQAAAAPFESMPASAPPKTEILSTSPLKHPALLQYLSARKIPFSLASQYCQEVHYQNGGNHFFGIGFANRSGGFELRSRGFKGSSSPKDFTILSSGLNRLSVFEGFLDFLSYLVLAGEHQNELADYLILNSLAFLEKAMPLMNTYGHVDLYLDNDSAGQEHAARIQKAHPAFRDRSGWYRGYEDLNDFLCGRPMSPGPENGQQPERPP